MGVSGAKDRAPAKEAALADLAATAAATGPVDTVAIGAAGRRAVARSPQADDLALAGVVTDPSPRFEPGDPAMLQYMEEHGYAVVAGVAPPAELVEAKRLLWLALGRHGMQPRSPDTWGRPKYPGDQGTGIVAKQGFGQTEFLWYLRGLERVQSAFAALWGTEELITSFDGGNVFRPWDARPEWRTRGGWYHIDQGAARQGRVCVQGLVSLYDADEATGGLVVIPGSHHEHAALCARNSMALAGDFVPLAVDDPLRDRPARLVCLRAGDLALWDSRTVHCNFPGGGPAPADDELLRAVGYVCMVPRSRASKEVLAARLKAFEERRTTTHWPDRCRCSSGTGIMDDEGYQQLRDLPPSQRRLVGVTEQPPRADSPV